MGCVIKYKGQSIPEEQFLQYLNKQIAINNLFNENENLANEVYKALGFKTKTSENEITRDIKEELPFKVIGNYNEIDEGLIGRKFYEEKIGNDLYRFEISNYSYPNEDGSSESFYDIDFTVNGSEEVIGTGFFDKAERAKQILQALLSQNFGNDTVRFNVEESKKGKQRLSLYKRLMNQLGYNPSGEMEYALFYDIKTDKVNLTPQQKQQAQQLYSRYLESLNKPNTNPILQGNQEAVITPNDKIVFGHPTIGKTFLKEKGITNFISFDDDFAEEINNFVNTHKGSLDKYQYKQSKPKEYIDFSLSLYDKAKAQAKKESKILFTSSNIIFENRINDFDKVINLEREEFFKRIRERKTTYDIVAWKDQIDNLISKVDSNKVINTRLYLSDLLKNAIIKPTDKIIWGHPAIGKSYAAKKVKMIDFDSYKLGINKKYNLYIAPGLSDTELRTDDKTREARENWRYESEENQALWNQFIRDVWQQAKKDAKEQGAILFASDLLVLREFGNEVDKALTMPDELFFERSKQRNNFIEGELGTKVWKGNLNRAVNNFKEKFGEDKVISTEKYLSDLFTNTQQEQVKKFAELQERLNNKEFLKGAKNAFESSEELQNVYYEALGFGQESDFKQTFKNSLWRGQAAKPKIDNEGNLILNPSYEELSKDYGKSFTTQRFMAESYGKRYSNNPYLIEIDEDHVSNIYNLQDEDVEGEKRIIGKEQIKIPKEKFNIIAPSFKEYENENVDNLIKSYIYNDGLANSMDEIVFGGEVSAIEGIDYTPTEVLLDVILKKLKTDFDGLLHYIAKKNIENIPENIDEYDGDIYDIYYFSGNPASDLVYSAMERYNKDYIPKVINYSENNQITSQQKQDALNAYTDYIARVSLGIIKNPSSGKYNYESQVKDIIYHGANEPIEGEKFTKREGATGRGIWFSGSRKYAQIQMDRAQPSESLIGRKLRGAPTMYQVVLNIKNPKNFYNSSGALLVQTPSKFEEQYDRKNNDAALFHHPNSKKPATADSADQVVVFEPEQIHILGSKQDIEGFKEFVKESIKPKVPQITDEYGNTWNEVNLEGVNTGIRLREANKPKPAYEFKPNAGDALAYEEDYDSIATVPKVSKERGDDAQVIARFKSLINRLKLLKNNPSLNKFKIQEKIDLYQSEIDKYKQADTTDEKIEILQLLAEESLTDSEEAMGKDNLSPAQLRNILSSAEMWKDFRQFVEVDNVSAEIGLLENRANTLKLAVYNRIVDYMKEQSSKTKYNLSSDDIKQLDEDGLLLNILDIKQSRNKMIRYIGYQIERMGIEKELEVKRKVDESNKLFEKLSNLDFDKLFKKDAKGRTMRNHFIYEVNDEFYDARKKVGEQVKLFFDPATKEQLTKLVLQAVSGGRADAFKDAKDLMYLSSKLNKEYIDATIDAAREAALDPALNEPEIVYYAFNKGIKKAKEARTTWYKENTITLNPAAFMSGTTPEERQRIIDEFKAAVGNDHYAESRIKTGENRVNRYYKDQTEWRLYLEEKHIGDDEAFKTAMDEWEYANNPFWYYDSIHNEANIDPEIAELISKTRDFDKLPAYAPSKPEHYDNQFKEVLANENLLNLYNFMTEYMKEAVRLFPPDASKEVGVDFFVKMQATAWESFMNNGISGLKTNTAIVDAVAVQHNFEHINQVDELGNPLKQISYERFLDVDKERLNLEALLEDPTISPQDRNIYQKRIKEIETSYTLDLKKTMQLLITQVESFRFSNEIADAAELQLYMVNQAKESTNSGYKNVGLSTTKKVTNYAVEAGVYNMYRADPDQANKNDFWGDNVFENKDVFGLTSDKKKKAREIKEKAMAIEPMYRGYIEKLDRGEELSDAADPTTRAEEIQQAWDVINSYNNYKKEYKDLDGKRSSFSKFIDWGIEVTQLKTMGLSFVSPITNLNFGVLSNYKEALVGQFLNVKECSAALKEMLSTTNNFLTWGKGGKNKKREKIVNFLEKNNLIFDIMEANYGKGQRVSYDKMFMWMRSSDFFMKGQLIIGSLMHDQIETVNGPKSLWSLVKEDGTIDESQVPEWNKDKQIDMIQKLLALSRRVHGNTDTKSAKFSNKFALGRALGQFKASWMSEGLNSAYNHSREDEILGARLEGRIRALPRLYREMKALKDNSGAGTWIGKWSDAMSNIKNMEEGDIYNIRRLAIDGVMIISLYMLYISLKMLYNSMTDDDKYKKMALGGTMNLLYRLRNDVQFYTSVGTFKEITSNPIPSLRIITDFQKAIYQTADIMNPMNDTDADDIERTMKNWAKTAPVTRQIVTNSNMVNDLYEDYQY